MSPAVHDKLDATINDLKGKPDTVNKRLRYKLDSTAVAASAAEGPCRACCRGLRSRCRRGSQVLSSLGSDAHLTSTREAETPPPRLSIVRRIPSIR